MNTLLFFESFILRNNPFGYEHVVSKVLNSLRNYHNVPQVWGKVNPLLVLSKYAAINHKNVVMLPESVSKELMRLGTEWNQEAIGQWMNLMRGTGKISELFYDILYYLYKKHPFENIIYWGSNDTVKKFADSVGACSMAMELGPTRSPFFASNYCDFAGVNGDSHSKHLILEKFSEYDPEAFLAGEGIVSPSGRRLDQIFTPIESEKSKFLYNSDKPLALLVLQLDDDSNCLIHSDFNGMKEVVSMAVPELVKAGWQVLVKPHPAAALSQCQGKDRILNYLAHEECRTFIKQNFNETQALWVDDIGVDGYMSLLFKSDAVISVNSSVCFEAILLGKVACVLGEAPYNVDKSLPAFDQICSGSFDKKQYDKINRQIANVMLNYYLYSGDLLSAPWELNFAVQRNRLLSKVFKRGDKELLTEYVLKNPIKLIDHCLGGEGQLCL